jgi:RsiW-degrading membrane proteinase PrsW (M82 family)
MVAAAVTLPPALGALFLLLRRYEGYFEDSRIFFSLVVGFFGGLVVAFLENVLFRFDSPEFAATAGVAFAFAYYVAGYALVEGGAKAVVLGSGKFRQRKDTPYYGAALGLGFGMMLALQQVALAFDRSQLLEVGFTPRVALVFALLLCLATGTILTSGAAGVWIGRGSANGKLWNGLSRGAAVHMPMLVFLWFSPSPGAGIAVVPALAAVSYGVGILYYTRKKILDTIVPPEIRDQLLKERRREARRAALRDEEGDPPQP